MIDLDSMNKRMEKRGRVRKLTADEVADLRRDMVESSVWARAELKRRREEKAKQSAEHGTNNGTTTEPSPEQP